MRYARRTMEPVARRTFTVDEVYRMLEVGILAEDEHVELLDGELVVVTPQGPAHSSLAVVIRRLLEKAYGDGFHVRDHSPFLVSQRTLPEPDVSVIRGEPADYLDALPTVGDAVLLVEVAVTSRALDRRKARYYAEAGVPAYWLVDVPQRRVEVRERPEDGEYRLMRVADFGETLALPELGEPLEVRALLAR